MFTPPDRISKETFKGELVSYTIGILEEEGGSVCEGKIRMVR
jgi:hypothetical protein